MKSVSVMKMAQLNVYRKRLVQSGSVNMESSSLRGNVVPSVNADINAKLNTQVSKFLSKFP